MSFIIRRQLSTLIPPKIASPNAIGAAKDQAAMKRVVAFYEKLPRGNAPEPSGSGPLAWYRKKYFGKNAGGQPLVHAIVFFLALGYGYEYVTHLKDHKNHPH